jgi:AcrR family transcriptional regulator
VAPATRERILDEAEFLFAREGVQGVTTRQITEAAEQRNTSAVTYHFGSRQGLLLEILARRGAPVDDQRGDQRDRAGRAATLDAIVACLVEPYAALLGSDAGRSYVRIVAQLRGRFAAWRVESDAATTKNLSRILDEVEAGANGPAPVRAERVVGLIMLMTGAVAERAHRIDDGLTDELGHDEFVTNLTHMCTAVVAA